MNSRGLLGVVMSCWVLWSATAEAQRGSEMDNNLIYLPDAYEGEREILISGGCHAAAVGGVSAPHFFLSASRPYMIRGWNLFSGSFATPVLNGGGSIGLLSESFEGYRFLNAGLTYAKKLSSTWFVGAGFSFSQLKLSGSENSALAGYRLAIQYRPSVKMGIAVEMERAPNGHSPYRKVSAFPSGFRMEWWMRISSSVQSFLLIQKSMFAPPSLAFVLKYIPHEKIRIRLGLDATVSSFLIGFGIQLDRMRIELNSGFHPYLGLTAGAALSARTRPPEPSNDDSQ